MTILLWVGVALVLIFGVPAVFFFALYMASGELVPRDRAVKLGRWAWLLVLITFNTQIWGRVITSVIELIRR